MNLVRRGAVIIGQERIGLNARAGARRRCAISPISHCWSYIGAQIRALLDNRDFTERDWRKVADSGSTSAFTQAIVFADYCQESWWYAFESTGADVARIAKINGPDCIVSESLREFLEGVLRDDPIIYGPKAG